MESEKLLDDVNWRILVELQENARASYTELGRKVGLTQPAVAERVRRLEEAGVIQGYRAEVNLQRLGVPILALIRVAIRNRQCGDLGAIARQFPEIIECHRVTGSDCYQMKVAVSSVQHLESLIDSFYDFGDSTTSIVLSSPVTRRTITQDTAKRDEGMDTVEEASRIASLTARPRAV